MTAAPVAIDAWPCAGALLGDDGAIVQANHELAERLGRDADTLAGQSLSDWLSPASRLLWATALWPALLARQRLDEVTLVLDAAGGPWTTLAALRRDSRGAAGGRPLITLWLLPAGDRQRLQNELRNARHSLDAMPGAVLQCWRSASGAVRFPYASRRLLDLLGVTPGQAMAHGAAALGALPAAAASAFDASLAAAESHGDASWRVLLQARHHPERSLEQVARRGRSGVADALWHGAPIDVSKRDRLQAELRVPVLTDLLTRLPNRRGPPQHLHAASMAADRLRCSSWTWTVSSRSTAAWVMPSATRCCTGWRSGCAAVCARPTRCGRWAAAWPSRWPHGWPAMSLGCWSKACPTRQPLADPATVLAGAQRLRQALINLVVNAIKYNWPGGLVQISMLHCDGR